MPVAASNGRSRGSVIQLTANTTGRNGRALISIPNTQRARLLGGSLRRSRSRRRRPRHPAVRRAFQGSRQSRALQRHLEGRCHRTGRADDDRGNDAERRDGARVAGRQARRRPDGEIEFLWNAEEQFAPAPKLWTSNSSSANQIGEGTPRAGCLSLPEFRPIRACRATEQVTEDSLRV